MEIKISIIIPIYNSELYLGQSIESVLNQTYKNIEVILIDDGSTDDSGIICDEYAQMDKRVVVIHKENAGVSAARNSGIDIATGEFIVFVDADDRLDIDILEQAIQSVKSKKVIYQWGYTSILEEKKIAGPELLVHNLTKEEILAAIIGWTCTDNNLGYYFRAVWGKLLFADLIKKNGIYFPENLYIGEDAIFLLKYAEYIDGIKIVSNYGYNYRISDTSAVGRYKSDLLEQYEIQLQEILNIKDQDHFAIKKALVAFCYEGFHSLVKNSQKGYHLKKIRRREQYRDAKIWFKKYGYWMKQKNIDVVGMRKLHKLQYNISNFCPFIGHYYIVKIIG